MSDCNYLWFFWWLGGDLEKELEEYWMLVYLFGGVLFLSCVNYVLKKIVDYNREEFDVVVVEIVKWNFYVDDCFCLVVIDI